MVTTKRMGRLTWAQSEREKEKLALRQFDEEATGNLEEDISIAAKIIKTNRHQARNEVLDEIMAMSDGKQVIISLEDLEAMKSD